MSPEGMKIYHNPRCRKSRETLNIIQNHGIEPDIVLYLETPPSRKEIKEMLTKLNMKAFDLIRKEEKLYKSEYKGKELSEEEWIVVMADNPKLIQRPVVLDGKKGIIGRPPESVHVLLS